MPWALELKLELGGVGVSVGVGVGTAVGVGTGVGAAVGSGVGVAAEGLVFWLPVAGQWGCLWEILELSVVLAY